MTHRPIKTLEDGTRVYASYHRYTPIADEDRTYQVRKPANPEAVRWFGEWLLPLDLLSDDVRAMPATRSDEEAYEHMFKDKPCRCDVCRRPEAEPFKRRWLRHQKINLRRNHGHT